MTSNGTPIVWPLRLWFLVEVFFGIAAILTVAFFPAETKNNFAWPIQPVVTAALFGVFYFATTPTLILTLFAKRWEIVRVIVIPAIIFTTLELIATFLHWEKFLVGTRGFYVWFASYLLPPPIFLATYLWQQRRASPLHFDDPLSSGFRRLLQILGGIIVLISVVSFIHPAFLISVFPWKLTPLTTRALCGYLSLVGTLLLSIAHENDRARVRICSPMLLLIFPIAIIQVARYATEVNWANPASWILLILFALISGCGLMLARGNWRDIFKPELANLQKTK
jgi:hypothetical protein